jgi:hypothetical protein
MLQASSHDWAQSSALPRTQPPLPQPRPLVRTWHPPACLPACMSSIVRTWHPPACLPACLQLCALAAPWCIQAGGSHPGTECMRRWRRWQRAASAAGRGEPCRAAARAQGLGSGHRSASGDSATRRARHRHHAPAVASGHTSWNVTDGAHLITYPGTSEMILAPSNTLLLSSLLPTHPPTIRHMFTN